MLQRQNSPNKNYQRGTCKEDEDYSFGREGYGNRLLRFEEIVLIDYMKKGKTIAGILFIIIGPFENRAAEKRPRLTHKEVLFYHNNTPAHFSVVVAAKLMELRFQLVLHPPYSPDLATSDYYLFPNLKKWLAGRFYSN